MCYIELRVCIYVHPGAKITLDDSFYKISEDGGSVDIYVLLKTVIKREVAFELTVSNITAECENKYLTFSFLTAGKDFDPPAVLTGSFTEGGNLWSSTLFL